MHVRDALHVYRRNKLLYLLQHHEATTSWHPTTSPQDLMVHQNGLNTKMWTWNLIMSLDHTCWRQDLFWRTWLQVSLLAVIFRQVGMWEIYSQTHFTFGQSTAPQHDIGRRKKGSVLLVGTHRFNPGTTESHMVPLKLPKKKKFNFYFRSSWYLFYRFTRAKWYVFICAPMLYWGAVDWPKVKCVWE